MALLKKQLALQSDGTVGTGKLACAAVFCRRRLQHVPAAVPLSLATSSPGMHGAGHQAIAAPGCRGGAPASMRRPASQTHWWPQSCSRGWQRQQAAQVSRSQCLLCARSKYSGRQQCSSRWMHTRPRSTGCRTHLPRPSPDSVTSTHVTKAWLQYDNGSRQRRPSDAQHNYHRAACTGRHSHAGGHAVSSWHGRPHCQDCQLRAAHLSDAYTRTSSSLMRRRPVPRIIFQLSITWPGGRREMRGRQQVETHRSSTTNGGGTAQLMGGQRRTWAATN